MKRLTHPSMQPRHEPRSFRACVASCVVAFTMSTIPVGFASQARAAFSPCNFNNSYFAGYVSNVNTPQFAGVSAHLLYQSDHLCTPVLGLTNKTSTWTMVVGGDYMGWSQSGQELYGGETCSRHFAQQEENFNYFAPVTKYGSCVSSGEQHQVWQQYLPTTKRILANIDTTNFITSSYNPFAPESSAPGSGWAEPFQLQIQGEVNYLESDISGTTSAASHFSGTQIQRYVNDAWVACSGWVTFVPDSPLAHRYSQQSSACNNIYVWTNNPNGY